MWESNPPSTGLQSVPHISGAMDHGAEDKGIEPSGNPGTAFKTASHPCALSPNMSGTSQPGKSKPIGLTSFTYA